MESQKDGQWVVSGAVVKMNVDGAEIDVTQLMMCIQKMVRL